MCSVNERIEKLKKETANLRKEVQGIKEMLLQQNELILNLLNKQIDMLDETTKLEPIVPQTFNGNKISEFSRRFPLQSLEDLEKFERQIDDENKNNIVSIIKSLLSPRGLFKNIVSVISENIIIETNVDGHHNKQRLLNYPKTIDVLYLACRKDIKYSQKLFLNDLRRALKMVKNRYHKNKCRARQKLREEQEKLQEQKQDTDASCSFGKTEEIYFE